MSNASNNSTTREFIIVVSTAFGLLFLFSLTSLFFGRYNSGLIFNNTGTLGLLIYEIIILFYISLYLRYRGWQIKDFNLDITWRLTGMGLIIFVCMRIMVGLFIAISKTMGIISNPGNNISNSSHVGLLVLLALPIVNPIFEETIVTGYIYESLQGRLSSHTAIIISVGVRFLYHLHQGAFGAITIIPVGILFAYIYSKKRKLWPLVFAHSLSNISTLIYVYRNGV